MKKWKKSSPTLVKRFYEHMQNFKDAELRKMFGYPCAFVHGNMFSGLHEENWIVRLRQSELNKAFESGAGLPFAPMKGRLMKEYVALATNVIADPEKCQFWLEQSYDYLHSLPIKPAKKSKQITNKPNQKIRDKTKKRKAL